ncbi:TRAP transporter small permease subunit [Vannielia sp.]|uniref:TRAP transporter small permease n=1 Tax=Vannielia sp. TaxID=2813045 RepID=UPI002620C234|nr:TRAP transporter small permease subunit [Vannielia sp.]MDF1872802.1 TRAP transporter small permease subunit [Vannielia sp.]
MLKAMIYLARTMALIGGAVLTALVILTCISVMGRELNALGNASGWAAVLQPIGNFARSIGIGPINGDFEVVEAGVAFAIFAFLPVAQLYSSHATVDVFTSFLSRKANMIIMACWELVFCIIILLITARLFAGFEGKLSNGETSLMLQFPIWWAYLASFVAAIAASVVAVYVAIARWAELATGRQWLPGAEGAER